jgi:menaquinone-dependent protoporphyrinogen oxidase
MRVLVTYGSERGGTGGLTEKGLTVDLLPPEDIDSLDGYDAVVVDGALKRHTSELKQRPVNFFSSGPLDDSAIRTDIPPVKGLKALMERVGARGQVTFGGRLAADAKGFPASTMAKNRAGTGGTPRKRRSGPGASPHSSRLGSAKACDAAADYGRVRAMDAFFRLIAAGPLFFVSAWLLMIFAGIVSSDVGIAPFGYITAMVVTIGLWLTLAPAIGAVSRVTTTKTKKSA